MRAFLQTEMPVTVSRPRPAIFHGYLLPFVALALCVFTWGLQYKLSLYDPPQAASHQIPTAKLLSKDEQGTAKASPLINASSAFEAGAQITLPGLLFAFLLLALDLFYCRLAVILKGAAAEQPWHQRSRSSLNAFSFRPPPILAFA